MTRPHATDGMIQLALMPFPFFNPLNWSAMTPSRTLAASLFVLRCSLDGWRHVGDAVQTSLRAQQDAMLEALQQTLDHAATASAMPIATPEPTTRRRASKASTQTATVQAMPTIAAAAPTP